MNLRFRTLKCYQGWIYSEKMIQDDVSGKIKFVKVPKDNKEPLTTAEVKRIFKVLYVEQYDKYQDSVIMLVILDCSARINELLNVRIYDYNRKDKTIKIGSETTKTREARFLSISTKMAKHLEKLIDIARSNNEECIFNSIYIE